MCNWIHAILAKHTHKPLHQPTFLPFFLLFLLLGNLTSRASHKGRHCGLAENRAPTCTQPNLSYRIGGSRFFEPSHLFISFFLPSSGTIPCRPPRPLVRGFQKENVFIYKEEWRCAAHGCRGSMPITKPRVYISISRASKETHKLSALIRPINNSFK